MTTERWASEDKLAKALEELTSRCDELNIDLLLIGAFAVRAYAERRRLTTDLDFVAPGTDRESLAALFIALGYEYNFHSRFGGMQAVKYIGEEKIQLDVAVDEILDQNTGNAYPVPLASFRQKSKVYIVPLEGGHGVAAYVLPLSDLLVTKLLPVRQQDAADVITLILTDLSPHIVVEFKRKVRKVQLKPRVNTRLGEIVNLPDRALQDLMSDYTGGRLTINEIRTLRSHLRKLRV